ncbi:Ca-activated chloride channel family protein [Catalinimonas alkaloidigena]|uniref:Ca-activated chloride channel family protein n=1 Tax=Catalinimonas alkaloidigena TaxID=1075417 RepID=A0A1G9H0F5_9BACT|nr:VWA domain-containing protein [Catalinimonas alkaloidigena]SDL05993.1 Ca-activated chloride channel family protein [Catalinimonas alkaloidigena]
MINRTNSLWEWLDPMWFRWSILRDFEWVNPFYLYLIALLPLLWLLRWLFMYRFREKIEVALFDAQEKPHWTTWLRFLPPLLFALSVGLVLMALARPQKTSEQVDQYTEGIDIMLVLDISESMKIEDFRPNRLEAAKNVAREFIAGRFQDRIGIVVFSGDAYSLAPLTTDYKLLTSYIDDIDFKMIQKGGTAIGSALAVATNRMRESDSKSKVIILLSDGDNTAGNIDPITAAELAKAYNIKMYTIGIGKEGRVPYGRDVFGRPQYLDNTMDETTLRQIANIGDGSFYRVSNNEALSEVFARIDQLEKAEIKETRYRDTRDYYDIYLTWGVLLFLGWLLTKNTFMSNAMED